MSVTARGVTLYAVHGYAGRVGPSVFCWEGLSKLLGFERYSTK